MATARSALDATEKTLVEQSRNLDGLNHRELTELARLLRRRRERVLRMMRDRERMARRVGSDNPDMGAREKRAELIAAIERINEALEARTHANRNREVPSNPKPSARAAAKTAPVKASTAKPVSAKGAEPKTGGSKPAAKAADKSSKAKADKEKPAKK